MLHEFLRHFRDPDQLQTLFYYCEIALVVVFGAFVFWFRYKSPESHFQVRESDLKKQNSGGSSRGNDPTRLANARLEPKASPKLLSGISIEGKPHEILGISAQATPAEIQKAYRKLMKVYHPDRIGPADSPQWKEAQKIAEAVNRAKDEMLKGVGPS